MPSLEEGAFRGLEEARGGGCPPEGPGGSVGHPQAFGAPALPPRLHVLLTQLCHRPPLEFSFHFTCWAVVSECPARHTGHHAASSSQQWKFSDGKGEGGKARSEIH